MAMKQHNFLFGITLLISLLLFSCGGEEQSTNQAGEDTATETLVPEEETPINEIAEFRFSFTIANLPAPMTVLNEISNSDPSYKRGFIKSDSKCRQLCIKRQKRIQLWNLWYRFGICGYFMKEPPIC